VKSNRDRDPFGSVQGQQVTIKMHKNPYRRTFPETRPLQNGPFCPISASVSNCNPLSTQCIPVVKIFAFPRSKSGIFDLNLKKNEHFSKSSLSNWIEFFISQCVSIRCFKTHCFAKRFSAKDTEINRREVLKWLTFLIAVFQEKSGLFQPVLLVPVCRRWFPPDPCRRRLLSSLHLQPNLGVRTS